MWALALNDSVRHAYGGQDPPLAICSHKGKYPVDYNSVHVPKCRYCLLMWPSYGKERGKKE